MKKSCLWNLTLGMFLPFFMQSCSITPRYHSFGYHVEWKSFHGKEIEKSNSKCNGDTEHQTEKYAQQKSAPNAEISPVGVTEVGSNKEEFRRIIKDSPFKYAHPPLRTSLKIESAKTTDTTPSKVGKPIKSAVEKIATPQGIEVLNRKIKMANWLILLSHGPLFYIFWEFSQIKIFGFWEFFIFLSLLGLASIPILIALIHRFELGRKRRTLYYSVNIQNKEAARLLAKYYSRAVIYLFFAGNVLLGIFLLTDKFKMKELFNKINTLEPNNEYVLEQQEKIEFLYDISMVLFYLSLGGIILRLIV